MKRWNGWGDNSIHFPLLPAAEALIETQVGPGTSPRDFTLAEASGCVPESRLRPNPLVSVAPADRLRHARGQSLTDLIALRTSYGLTFPDGAAYPTCEDDVRALLDYARDTDASLIPYGGGTSVVGHINPLPGKRPILTVDLSRFSRMRHLDTTSHLALVEAGISGANLEAQLRAHGYTLGHFPQSFDYSTLGGWIATRSKGQQSLYYGGIEKLFAGGRLETPQGQVDLRPFVATAAGPDLRELVLGSEGRLGIITLATVRVSPLPAFERFEGVFFPDFESGLKAVRKLASERVLLSMVRLSDPLETRTNLALAGHPRQIAALEWALQSQGCKEEKCLLLLGATGASLARAALRHALGTARLLGGVLIAGEMIGRAWRKTRFRSPYLRDGLWEKGYAVETVETAVDWSRLEQTRDRVLVALRTGLQDSGERVMCFSHLSHVYPTGSSLYTTYVYRLAADPAEMLWRAQVLKTAASRAIVAMGATITHQHGIGLDHLPYMEVEKHALGAQAIGRLCEQFDPLGLMNPGKLVAARNEGQNGS